MLRRTVIPAVCVVFLALAASSAQTVSDRQQLAKRIFERERATVEYLSTLRPVLETYLQATKDSGEPDHGDLYFLGEWNVGPALSNAGQRGHPSLALVAGQRERSLGPIWNRYRYYPDILSELFFVDVAYFSPQYYSLTYARDETLGGIECAVFNVQPVPANAPGLVLGRLWVEVKSASIVRIHGKFTRGLDVNRSSPEFDSWRWLGPSGYWVPSYLYSEATIANPASTLTKMRMRMSTMVWGYERSPGKTHSEAASQAAPVLRQRSGSAKGETSEPKIVRWLAENGLLAERGPVDQNVCSVARAMMQASGLPPRPISCRVLLTSPLESFTVGQTIVVSRGLLDLVPDEAALAAVIAHEVAHVLLGHTDPPAVDASGNIFARGEVPSGLRFHANRKQEAAARALAAKLVLNSPYAGTLSRLLEFAAAIQQRRDDLHNVFRARFGGEITSELVTLAKTLDAQEAAKPGALPLGSRIELNPASDTIEFATVYRGIPSRTFPFGVAAKIPAVAPVAAERAGLASSRR